MLKGGFTGLHHASQNGHFGVVEVIIKRGAYVNTPTKVLVIIIILGECFTDIMW